MVGTFTLGYLHRFEPFGQILMKSDCAIWKLSDPDGQMVKLAARKDPIAYALGEIFTSDEVRPNIVPDLQLAARHYEISSQEDIRECTFAFSNFML